jgi:hypothetical protein
VHPVEPLVGETRQVELGGLRRDERVAFLLRVREAHDRLVPRERDVDDLADAELHAVVDLAASRYRNALRMGNLQSYWFEDPYETCDRHPDG